MKTAWLCFWFSFGAAEVGLTFWSHSATFLEIGAVVPIMIAFNLLRTRVGPHPPVQNPIAVIRPTPALG